jgi:hypothetical protein
MGKGTVPWQYLAPFWVVGCLQSLQLFPYGYKTLAHLPRPTSCRTLTENRFLEEEPAFNGCGRESTLLPPTFREPSLMLDDVDWNGSGAATFESFYRAHRAINTGGCASASVSVPFRTSCRP